MSDHISELLGEQPIVDENNLPDSGTTDADLETGGEQEAQQETQQQGEQDTEFGRRKTVPLGALQEERARRQELQEQLRQQSELNQRMQQRFEQMMGHFQQPQQQQPQQQEPEIPPFVDDPEGHVRALTEKFQRDIAALRQHYEGQNQQQQAAAVGQQLAQHVAAAEQEFMQTQADYPKAAEYFIQRKGAEYAAIGLDPVSIQQQLARDYHGLAVAAVQQGKNPAAVLYNLTRAMGYNPDAQPAQQQQQAPGGKMPAKAPTSLSGVAGTGRSPEESNGLTLEAIANMSDAEFDKVWKQIERGSRQAPRF